MFCILNRAKLKFFSDQFQQEIRSRNIQSAFFDFFFLSKKCKKNGRREGAKGLKRSNSKTNSQIGCLAINMN